MTYRYPLQGALLATVSVLAFGAAQAQSTTAPAQPAADTVASTGTQLSEIIVTASRKQENVQKAPLAITALSGTQLAQRGLASSLDLQQATPGLTFSDNGNFSEPYIRGVGTDITTPGAESSVATYIDGVYQASPYFGVQDLVEVERVEVLKGPQGTLYGRNATGGAINIKTKDPAQTFGGEASVSYGNYNSVEAVGYITGPITNTLSFNLALAEDRHDGFGKVLNTGQQTDFLDRQYVHGKLLYEPSSDFSLLLSGQFLNSYDTAGGYTYLTQFGATPLATLLGGKVTYDSYNIYGAYPFKNFTRDGQLSLRGIYNWNGVKITSLTAYSHLNGHIFPEFISTDIPIFDFEADDDTDKTVTEDLTFAQDTQRYSWIAGFSFLSDTAAFDPIYTYSGPTRNASIYATVDTTSYAGFGEFTYRFTHDLSVIGGIRYTSDTKKQARLDFGDGAGVVLESTPVTERTFDNATYKGVLQYSPAWGTLYAKFETGFKAGGVNAEAAADYVAPEKLTSYELGAKSEFFDRRLRLNGDFYYYRYSNLQSQYTSVATGASYFETAQHATVYGAEFTADAAVTRQLTVSAGVDLLHTRFDQYISNGSYEVIDGLDTPVQGLNLAGNHLTHSPPFTLNVGADWRLPLADGGNVTSSLHFYHSGKYYFDVTNREYQTPYSTLNGRVVWNLADHLTSLGVWANNLTNEKYLAVAVETAFGDDGQLAPPRTFGFTLARKF
jgi:iron complex outermembrane recepter protein